MAESKETHPLDELFRKSFDELPAAPAASGWDTPSAQVWENVQDQIKTTRTPWRSWVTAAVALVVTAVAVWFWYQNRPETTPANLPQTTPTEQPASQPQPTVDSAAPAPNAPVTTTPNTPVTGKSKKQTAPTTPLPTTEAEPLPGSSQPLPGAKKVFPNNTERNKRQENDDAKDNEVQQRSLPKPEKSSGGND